MISPRRWKLHFIYYQTILENILMKQLKYNYISCHFIRLGNILNTRNTASHLIPIYRHLQKIFGNYILHVFQYVHHITIAWILRCKQDDFIWCLVTFWWEHISEDRLYPLTHWGRVMHICVSTNTNIGSDNGLSPGRRQAIIGTNAGILLTGPLGPNFSEILFEILTFLFKKMRFKASSAKRRPFCLGLNVLTKNCLTTRMYPVDQTSALIENWLQREAGRMMLDCYDTEIVWKWWLKMVLWLNMIFLKLIFNHYSKEAKS